MKRFGKENYKKTAYFNFDEQAELKQFFAEKKDVQRIIKNLSLVYGQRITPHDTLIIFDEIHECSEALGTLKYFCEKVPEYDIVSAGSLLGVALTKGRAFPVRKVDFLDIFPITFSEFLASSSPQLADYIKSIQIIESLPDIFLINCLSNSKYTGCLFIRFLETY